MISRRHSRYRNTLTRLMLVLLATSMAAVVSACSGTSGNADTSSGTVTVRHSLGVTTVEGTPKRVVALGSQWLDSTLALGVTPVGYLDTISTATHSSQPWEPSSLNGAKSLQLSGDIAEQIAALNPDLILVPALIVDEATYRKLSRLAPTIGAVTIGAQVDRWTDDVTTLGNVLHRQSRAARVISDTNGRIAATAAKYPGLKGKTFLTCFLAGPAQLMVLADPKDGSTALFTALGMTLPENVVREATAGGRLALSPERLGELTSDMLVCGAPPGLADALKQLPGYSQLPSVEHNSVAFVDLTTLSAINMPTPLSLPYILQQLDPTFAVVSG